MRRIQGSRIECTIELLSRRSYLARLGDIILEERRDS